MDTPIRPIAQDDQSEDEVTPTMPLFSTGHTLVDALRGAPNPKPTASDKARFGKLASLYTAFSSDFATYALDICLRAGYTNIADPFSGMGTLAEVARPHPVNLRISDISPFAVLSGAFRSTSVADIEQGIALFEAFVIEAPTEDERAIFERVFSALSSHFSVKISTVLSNPTAPGMRVPAAVIYLSALSRIHLYKSLAGSNPTWVKRPNAIADYASALKAIKETMVSVREYMRHLPDLSTANCTTSSWSGIDSSEISSNSIDAIITSPPYANRTDYIRHYLPASELLLQAASEEERKVRARQIGTPLIRKSHVGSNLPDKVSNILEKIRTHKSYASERYYLKVFNYYFNDMYNAFSYMNGWLRKHGLLLMVVQDSYYKDLHIPTADLLVELATHQGFTFEAQHDWPVRQHLASLSPHSRRSMPRRPLVESVIALSK